MPPTPSLTLDIEVYVCPTPGCGNYFASSSSSDLTTAVNRRSAMRNGAREDPSEWGAVTGTRDECPDCRDRGAKVKRRRVAAKIVLEPVAA